MSWFSRFFNKNEHTHSKVEVPFSTLIRWGLYDLSIDSPNQIAALMGLNPVSDEGDQKEIEDSELRLEAISELLPFIDIVSDLNAEIIVSTQTRDFKADFDNGIDEEEIEAMADFYKAVSFSALVSAFSIGIELGIIHAHALSLGSVYKEEDEQ